MNGIDLTSAQRKKLVAARGDRSQAAVAKACGTTQATLSRVEDGSKRPSLALLRALCRHYGLRLTHVPERVEIS